MVAKFRQTVHWKAGAEPTACPVRGRIFVGWGGAQRIGVNLRVQQTVGWRANEGRVQGAVVSRWHPDLQLKLLNVSMTLALGLDQGEDLSLLD
jgi:hypothetical protein